MTTPHRENVPSMGTAALRHIVVIGGGANSEHDVSLASAAAVAEHLDRGCWRVTELTISRDGRWGFTDKSSGTGRSPGATATPGTDLQTVPIPELPLTDVIRVLDDADVIFPVLHGPRGEDGTIAALAELLDKPCVGSGVVASAVAMDKHAAKGAARLCGVHVARGIHLQLQEYHALALASSDTSSTASALMEVASQHGLELPLIVKPVKAGSSYGVAEAESPNALLKAVEAAFSFDDQVLVEEKLHGREIDIAVLEGVDGAMRLSPPLEIAATDQGFFSTENKYSGNAEFTVPAHLTDAQRVALETAARTVFRALNCRDIARVDFFLTTQGWVLNEVNTMPGMTPHSQLPLMFASAGLPYGQLVNELAERAWQRGNSPAQPHPNVNTNKRG